MIRNMKNIDAMLNMIFSYLHLYQLHLQLPITVKENVVKKSKIVGVMTYVNNIKTVVRIMMSTADQIQHQNRLQSRRQNHRALYHP